MNMPYVRSTSRLDYGDRKAAVTKITTPLQQSVQNAISEHNVEC